ncbi:hypothetical protein GF406_08995 [candidate division KSB1 bacterium]|nr:hypothetical protein [candidate division KSB1 bacterium]
MNFRIIFFCCIAVSVSFAQMHVKNPSGTIYLQVSSDGNTGIGDFTSATPQARLDVRGSGEQMVVDVFDDRQHTMLVGARFHVPFAETNVEAHIGALSSVDAPIDKAVYSNQIQANRAVAGRVYSRSTQRIAAEGQLASYEIALDGVLPNPPSYIYKISGCRGVLDADEIADDYSTTSDGMATALLARVEDNLAEHPHIFAVYAQGAKSAFLDKVGINTTTPEYDLDIDGDLRVSGTIYTSTGPLAVPDYVFEPDYKTLSLDEIEAFINTQKHLPWITSARKGRTQFDMGKLGLEMLETIENLQLQIIALNKKIEMLERN